MRGLFRWGVTCLGLGCLAFPLLGFYERGEERRLVFFFLLRETEEGVSLARLGSFAMAAGLFATGALGMGCAAAGRRLGMRRRLSSAWARLAKIGGRVPLTRHPSAGYTAFIVLLVLLAVLWGFDERFLIFGVDTLLMVILALGLNITLGLAGLFVLGYAAFFAIGAYSFAILSIAQHVPFWVGLGLGGFLAALVGIVVGLPSLRLRGDYLAIATLGLGETVRYILRNETALTGGPGGVPSTDFLRNWGLDPLGRYPIGKPTLLGWPETVELVHFYFLVVAMLAATIFVVHRIQNSRVGRAWMALREDEIAAKAMGIPVVGAKLSAFALSAVWGGFAGVVFAAKQNFVEPVNFTFDLSALVLCMVVLGGMGSIPGVILGALGLEGLNHFLRVAWGGQFQDYRLLLYGGIMILMMIFRPQGLLGGARRGLELAVGEDRPAY